MPLQVLLVDDEPLAREGLRLLLDRDPDVETIREARNGKEAVEAIQRDRPDLVFLDIQMPEMDGFGVVKEVGPEAMPPVVFITAHDGFAMQAFEIYAFDYLLKPVTQERFGRSLARVKERLKSRMPDDAGRRISSLLEDVSAQRQPLKRIAVRSSGKISLIEVGNVDWIEAAENYVQLHVGQNRHLLHVSMNAMERALDPEMFMRIHRSTIVNVGRIAILEPSSHGEFVVTLDNGVSRQSGRMYSARIKPLVDNPF